LSSLPLGESHGAPLFDDRLVARKQKGAIFKYACLAMTVFGVLALAALFYDIIGSTFTWAAVQDRELRGETSREVHEVWPLWDGIFNRSELQAETAEKYPEARLEFYSWINFDFFTQYPSRFPELAGFRSPILGSLLVIGLTALLSLPLGVAAAIYLEEYGGKGWLARFIEVNIANLAGVPSIIYGLLGLAIFVRSWESLTGGRTIIAGALVMTLLSLPVIIVAAREALRAVPPSIREAAYGVGATRWETTWSHVLPYALPGVLTGMILAMSRAIGETAPLITIGALTYIAFDPQGLRDTFTVMPIQIFNWVSLPQQAFHNVASAGIVILLAILLTMNALAIFIRRKTERNW
jgi:phosphate transport system permease protein